jgi:uncharacterized protein
MKKIAIIGSGIAGLGCAYALRDQFQLTIFESGSKLGGHANTVDVHLDGMQFGVDTGFLVYNEKTYPKLIKLFEELRIKVAASEMSFSVARLDIDREWCGTSLSSLFAQPMNALSPRFWSMIRDILRFNKEATKLALLEARATVNGAAITRSGYGLSEPLGQYLNRNKYGKAFSEDYLLPMAAAIWSCPIATMASFPIGSFVRFFHNHGLLQILNRPQWFTCEGGSRRYVQALVDVLLKHRHQIRLEETVLKLSRSADYVELVTHRGLQRFDGVVLACHSDQALKLLAAPSAQEREVLSAIGYQNNVAYLHCDQALMPKRQKAWAAWNYLSDQSSGSDMHQQVSVTYWLNRLQPLPCKTNLFVSLNPLTSPNQASMIQRIEYAHPILDEKACIAQRSIPSLQGPQNTWYAGAWCGFGFHEDGLKSGLDAAARLVTQMDFSKSNSPAQILAA